MKTFVKMALFALVLAAIGISQVTAQGCCGGALPVGNDPLAFREQSATDSRTLVAYSPGQDFSVPTLDGGEFTLSEQRGKPVVLFVMAYWCPTCINEAEALARIHSEYGDSVAILALDVDPTSTEELLARFTEWVGTPDYFFGFDTGGNVVRAYDIRALETTIIFNQRGEVVYTDTRPTSYDTLDQQIRALLE